MKFSKSETETLCLGIMLSETQKHTKELASQLTAFSCDMDEIKKAKYENDCNAVFLKNYTNLRQDKPCDSFGQSEITSNSKCTHNGCFTVTKVIGN